jgi:hypothetical protein
MFKIAHEVPICLLEESIKFNDYDYILFHLLEKYPIYKEFYENTIKQGRESVFDNSAYEFYINGMNLDLGKFANRIAELNPTYYVIPDKLNDFQITIKYLEIWKQKNYDIKSKTIGVVQGNNFKEWLECYNIMKNECDKIAISFGYNFLRELGSKYSACVINSKSLLYARGRRYLIDYLIDNDLIVDKPYHLLGCYLPFEFAWYKKYKFIDSIDTSFPVNNGYRGKKLTMFLEEEKEEVLIDNFIDKPLTILQKELILENIKIFRSKLNVWKNI